MCNRYEPASRQYVLQFWAQDEPSLKPYKGGIGPRDDGPFITPKGAQVGQWGMIRPGSPERIQRAAPKKEGRLGEILMTNCARADRMQTAPTYRDAWKNDQRCLIPANAYYYPYWGTGENIWWRFARQDGEPWMLAGLYNEWTDHKTGEIVPNYTMVTQNANAHPLLRLMHRPERDGDGNVLPLARQDKRSIVPIERADWDLWLTGSKDAALSLIQLPSMHLFSHRAEDPAKQLELPIQD